MNIDIDFVKAREVIETLGVTLTQAKIAVLNGIWEGWTYEEIAEKFSYESNYLKSQAVAKSLFVDVGNAIGCDDISKDNFRETLQEYVFRIRKVDWGKTFDKFPFYGRDKELEQLRKWILEEHTNLVMLWGMMGIGKTSLALKLSKEIEIKFDVVLWLPCDKSVQFIIDRCVEFISGDAADHVNISVLIQCLQKSRCLLILDDVGKFAAREKVERLSYLNESPELVEFIEQIAAKNHQSTVLITSRELSRTVESLDHFGVARSLKVPGLSLDDIKALLTDKGIEGNPVYLESLHDLSDGNPLALKGYIADVKMLWGGSLEKFFDRTIITWLFKPEFLKLFADEILTLGDLEQSVLEEICQANDPQSISDICNKLKIKDPKDDVIVAVESIIRKDFVELEPSEAKKTRYKSRHWIRDLVNRLASRKK